MEKLTLLFGGYREFLVVSGKAEISHFEAIYQAPVIPGIGLWQRLWNKALREVDAISVVRNILRASLSHPSPQFQPRAYSEVVLE